MLFAYRLRLCCLDLDLELPEEERELPEDDLLLFRLFDLLDDLDLDRELSPPLRSLSLLFSLRILLQ